MIFREGIQMIFKGGIQMIFLDAYCSGPESIHLQIRFSLDTTYPNTWDTVLTESGKKAERITAKKIRISTALFVDCSPYL